MRIVHVVRQFHPAIGGMENVVWELATAQLHKGHRVRVVTLDRVFGTKRREPLPSHERIGDLEVVRIPFVGSSRYPIAWGLARHIKNADIVHVHGVDSLFDHLGWTRSLHRRRMVVSTHGGYFHTSYASRLKRLYFPTVTRFLLRRYAGVATVSVADHELFGTIRPRGLTLIENGVNITKYAAAAAPRPTKAMIALGRFSINKRLDRVIAFLAALRKLDPGWSLKLVGRPADLSVSDLLALAEAAGVSEAVEIVASPSDEEIREVIAECSIVVSASDYEGFGLAVIEGMSAGLMPLLSEIPPFLHLVARTGVGLTVDFAEAELAAERFLAQWRVLEVEGDEYRQPAMRASAGYSWDRVSAQYEALYRSAIGDKTRSILGVPVGVATFPEARERLDERAERSHPTRVIFANAHTLNQASADGATRTALEGSLVLNDGIGVDLASRLLFGKWFPENMNGTDFVPSYLKHTRHRFRIFLLGARPGIAERAAERIKRLAPQHEIAGCAHGYFAAQGTAAIVEEIRRSKSDVLLVAMGNPKQELWLTQHLDDTGCRLGFGVGALFDFLADAVPRAPGWVQAARMEWFYRMLQEPRRLWRRYLVDMPVFLVRVGRQWFTGARVSSAME